MSASLGSAWPDLAVPGWQESAQTLHLWTQVIGKVRLSHAPRTNHWWDIALYVTARGLSTSPITIADRCFDIELDLCSHAVEIRTSEGARAGFSLEPKSTLAWFWQQFFAALGRLEIECVTDPRAVEIPEAIRLDQDQTVRRYDPVWVARFLGALVRADRLLKEFRAPFLGKTSPVHFFWGAFDLAVTRFSGRRAPLHPGGAPHVSARVMQEAYSHEVSSAGFWTGGPGFPEATFYAYSYPEPAGYATAKVLPPAARYEAGLREFVLPYAAVRSAPMPDGEVRAFLQSTYEAAADRAEWNRAELER
jgi:hypothetical protein